MRLTLKLIKYIYLMSRKRMLQTYVKLPMLKGAVNKIQCEYNNRLKCFDAGSFVTRNRWLRIYPVRFLTDHSHNSLVIDVQKYAILLKA